MYSIDHRDLGTPASPAAAQVTLEIDGNTVTVPAGTSVMRAAALAGARIPKLCATDTLKAFGSCRLCLVEIEGRRGYPASCTTEAAAGMQVRTDSPQLEKLRRGVVELYLSDHPLDCATCPADGHCELQSVAVGLGIRESRYAAGGATQRGSPPDASNPYFVFDPDLCIVCSRCVRACNEVQGTHALTIEGRGFASQVAASQHEPFLESECVSCGACVESCPTAALTEKSRATMGAPTRAVTTTCAYCGVGCSFKAEINDAGVVRMAPNRDGAANHGHACVKGRFAYGYATHPDRVLETHDPRADHRPLARSLLGGCDRARGERIPAHPGRLRAGLGRRHHLVALHERRDLPGAEAGARRTGHQQRRHLRAGVPLADRVRPEEHARRVRGHAGVRLGDEGDVIVVIGANPTDGHPVFASQIKRRLGQGARLIVIDPRVIDLVHCAHIEAAAHMQLLPGTNVALINALAHVVVTEGLADDAFAEARCEIESYRRWKTFVAETRNSPEATEAITGVPAGLVREAARIYAAGPNSAIYYGLGVTEHSQGTTMVMGIANLAMATGNLGREGVGVSPLRGQNNVQGSCDMGSFPHEFSGYRHVSDDAVRGLFEDAWKVPLANEPGLRIPNMFEAALDGSFRGLYVQGEDFVQSDPDTRHVVAAMTAMECVVVQDLFLNETARYAHVFLPGSSFLEKDGTFTNAERRISRVRKVMEPLAGLADWEITVHLAQALGYPMHYSHPSEIMQEIARLTPTFHGVDYDKLDRLGSIQWPCNDAAPEGTPTMHVGTFVRGKGKFCLTEYVATSERVTSRYPLILTTGRVLFQYNVGAQTRRTANLAWHHEDRLDIHPDDAESRGIEDGDWVGISSRTGDTLMRAAVSRRMAPGVVYTTFHFPESGANLVTTENSDWATNCPEYKVTAVQVVKVRKPDAWRSRVASERGARRTTTAPSA